MKQNDKDKTRTYKRTGLFMLVSALFGGAVGFLVIFVTDGRQDSILSAMSGILSIIQDIMLPSLLLLTAATIILGEHSLRKLRFIGKKVLETEDEECDRWEYEEEKTGAFGLMTNILSQILCILILSAGYSFKYIASGNHRTMLASCAVFLACYAYDGLFQARYVKTVQAAHPEKKGDPSSIKFRQQWLDSCDEAEKEMIYQSAYKTYTCMNTGLPFLLVITMIGHLLFDTGLMAIIVVAAIWLLMAGSYLHSCVSLKGTKITFHGPAIR